MKKVHVILLSVFLFVFMACTTSRTVVSDSADLSKYKYATISDVMNYAGSAALMDMEVKVYDVLSQTRLRMIGDKQVEDLTDEQKGELLLVRFAATQNDDESVVSVNFVDYITGKPVASCRGAFGLGWSKNNDMKVAIDKVAAQIEKLFSD